MELEIQRDDKIKELMSDIKLKSGKRVKDHVEFGRFPYTYAYDFKRLGEGSRGDTGHCLREQYGEDIKGFAKDIVSRAFSYLLKYDAEDFLFDILDEAGGTEVRDAYNFIRLNYFID